MADREEERDALRQARLDEEAREQARSQRARRLMVVAAGVVALIAAAGIAVLVSTSLRDESDGPQAKGSFPAASLPDQVITDERQAAEAAGCTRSSPPDEGRGHKERIFAAADYRVNPPTSGTHFPSWAQDGVYEPGSTPALGELVHTLEHGRVNIQYRKGSGGKLITQLEALAAENSGYHLLLYENATKMPYAVSATAWNQSLTCKTTGPKLWDALRTFRDAHLDRGPEKVA